MKGPRYYLAISIHMADDNGDELMEMETFTTDNATKSYEQVETLKSHLSDIAENELSIDPSGTQITQRYPKET